MTWAIGATNRLGAYGVVVSDIQVTFKDGSTADIVRKAYPVGPYLIGAFAGSVYIGFELLTSISRFLQLPPDAPSKACWIPTIVAEQWSPIARHVYENSPADAQASGAQFLLVGPHPTEDGIPGRAIPYICKFSSPTFEPEITRIGDSAISIGSGATVPKYIEAVNEALDIKNGMLQAEVGNTGGWAKLFAYAMNQTVNRHFSPGISPHMHFHVALRGKFEYGTSDRNEYPKDGPIREIRMPHVAESFSELLKLTEADCTSAIC